MKTCDNNPEVNFNEEMVRKGFNFQEHEREEYDKNQMLFIIWAIQVLEHFHLDIEAAYNLDVDANNADNRNTVYLINAVTGDRLELSYKDIATKKAPLYRVLGMMDDINMPVETLRLAIKILLGFKEKTLYNTKIGLDSYGGHTIYKLNGVIGVANKSCYKGKLPLRNSGDRNDIRDIVQRYVVGKPHMCLCLLGAVYGFVLDIIQTKQMAVIGGTHDLRLLINYVGESSIGKTSASLLTASVAGEPNEMLDSFNNTDKKIMERMFEHASVPLVLDEFVFAKNMSRSEKTKRLQILFAIHEGKQRGRVYLDAKLREQESDKKVSNAVTISTELSILEMLEGVEVKGYKARLLEVRCKGNDFFDGGEECLAFTQAIANTFGWGRFVIEHILDYWLTGDKITEVMHRYYDEIKNKIKGSNIQHRFAKRIALLLTTGKIIEDALGVRLDLNHVEDLLLKSIALTDEKSKPEQYYEKLNEYVSKNSERFCDKLTDFEPPLTYGFDGDNETDEADGADEPKEGKISLGVIMKEGDVTVLYAEHGFFSYMIDKKWHDAVEAWYEKGLLLSCTKKSRFTCRPVINNGKRSRLYCVKLDIKD